MNIRRNLTLVALLLFTFIANAQQKLTSPDGNFEMDFNDGELRYKLLLTEHNFLQKDSVALANMKRLMFIGMQSWMRYGNSIVDIMFGKSDGTTVKDMVAQCEQS